MSQCPCINCITFPICKLQVNDFMKFYSKSYKKTDYVYSFYKNVLKPKCSVIEKWVENEYMIYNILYDIYKG